MNNSNLFSESIVNDYDIDVHKIHKSPRDINKNINHIKRHSSGIKNPIDCRIDGDKKIGGFKTGFGPFTDSLINNVFDNLDAEKLRNKLTDKFVDPMYDIINQKLQPYIYVGITLYSIVIVLLFIIIYLLVIKKKI
jgi:hypothetical protein